MAASSSTAAPAELHGADAARLSAPRLSSASRNAPAVRPEIAALCFAPNQPTNQPTGQAMTKLRAALVLSPSFFLQAASSSSARGVPHRRSMVGNGGAYTTTHGWMYYLHDGHVRPTLMSRL